MVEKEISPGRGQSSWEGLWLGVILLSLGKHFHFGIAILILNVSPLSALLFVVCFIGC